MRILVIYRGSFPNGYAMTKRLKLYTKGLKEIGNDVEIIIPHASDKAGSKVNFHLNGVCEGVKFKYLSKNTERSSSFFLRRLNDFIGYFNLCKYIISPKTKFNVIFLVDVRDFWRIPIYFLGKIRKSKVVYELNEHPLVFSGKFKYWLERKFIFPLFDGFIVISQNLRDLVSDFKKKDCELLKVPIITDSILIDDNDYKTMNNPNKYIIHSGGLSDKKEGVIGLIKALHFVLNNQTENIDLYFTGNINSSPDKKKIMETIERLELKGNVKFLGFLSDYELLSYQKNSFLAIINKPSNLQNDFCFPTKLGEYLVLAKPVLVTGVGEYMNYLKNDFNAVVLEGNSPECIGKNMIKVLKDKAHYDQIGINGKYTADSVFNYKVQAKFIDNFFNSLIQ